MRVRLTAIALAALAVVAATAGIALARRPHHSPPGLAGVRSVRVAQAGRRVDWRVTLVHPFSPRSLGAGRRTVCLLLERRGTGAVTRRLCLAPAGARSRGLALTVATVRGAHVHIAHQIAAAVTRSGPHTVLVTFAPTVVGLPYRSLRWQVSSTSRGRGCPSTAQRHDTCTVLFPARRHPLARLHTPRLVGCVAKGPSLVYSGPANRHEIALTFDDGPWPDPPSIDFVDELHRLGVPATFFEIGDQLSEYDPTGSVQRAMLADGDMIGDHTWTHPADLTSLSPAQQTSELMLTADAIRRATGFTPCLWRPPYGSADGAIESLARGLGFLTMEWNDDPRDWSLPGVASIVHTAVDEAQNGSIVEMHFGGGPRYETLDAIPQIVADLRARGFRFVNLAQLLGLREIWR